MKEKIRKLLMSSVKEDISIGVHLMKGLDNQEIIDIIGGKLYTQYDETEKYDYYALEFSTEKMFHLESSYWKMDQGIILRKFNALYFSTNVTEKMLENWDYERQN